MPRPRRRIGWGTVIVGCALGWLIAGNVLFGFVVTDEYAVHIAHKQGYSDVKITHKTSTFVGVRGHGCKFPFDFARFDITGVKDGKRVSASICT